MPQYLCSQTLGDTMLADAQELLAICQSSCPYHLSSYLEEDFAPPLPVPRYYFAYEGQQLIGFLSLFLDDKDSGELYGTVHPSWRHHSVFHSLYNQMLQKSAGLLRYLQVPLDPQNHQAAAILKHYGGSLYQQEYLLALDPQYIPVPKMPEYPDLYYRFINSPDSPELHLVLLSHSQVIGECHAALFPEGITIFDLEIQKENRSQGCGSYLLDLLLVYLKKHYQQLPVLLQLHGGNPAARALYLHHGFLLRQQLDYYQLLLS